LFILAYVVAYFAISLYINFFSDDFNLKKHTSIIHSWKPQRYPSIDIFLPTCGESIQVLKNTWDGVSKLRSAYPGVVTVYSLDDAHSQEVRELASQYNFVYYARPNKGWFKKAGNLRYGYEHSSGEFIAIFDADFVPRFDFLKELLPYFFFDPKLGIVQTPQYFDVNQKQNWLERGAGAVQEFFYRVAQTSRQSHEGAICVGSNAIYRRRALDEIGGTALIEHSEDVHTGFKLRQKGWDLLYLPVILAKGLCPAELPGFFKQQYRWCMGSMSLLTSRDFWKTKMPLKSRLCYFTGFMYYIHTAVYSILLPVVPLIMLLVLPTQIKIENYLLISLSLIYMHIVLPLWHDAQYGIETASVKSVYGWAHLFALIDRINNSVMEWQPTGAVHKKDSKYKTFRIAVIVFNFVPALVWVSLSLWYMITWNFSDFVFIFILGLYYLFVILKIVVYSEPQKNISPKLFAEFLPAQGVRL
jgi:cellulose synthase (UDP-forming)